MILDKKKIPGMKETLPVPEKVWTSPMYFLAFGLGSGCSPYAPGTVGTLFAIPFYLMMAKLPLSAYLTLTVLFILFSMIISERVSREIDVHDHPGMCIDEFAGFFVTMINAPHGIFWIILGFLLFRFFDIFKPWPIRWLDEKVHGGFGMVLDDVVAGVFAMIIIQIIKFLL